jgi:hypothetical protein
VIAQSAMKGVALLPLAMCGAVLQAHAALAKS